MRKRNRYRKIPEITAPYISPSKYKPSKPVPQKKPPLYGQSEYKPPRDLVLGSCPQIQSKKAKTVNFPPTISYSPIDF